MFNNTTPFGPGASSVVQTPAVTDPTLVFPGTTVTSNFTFIIVPPPPFPAPPGRSIDLSPLKLIFAIIAIVAVPTLAYALFFSFPCSSSRRRSSSSSEDTHQVTVDISPPITDDHSAVPESEVELKKDTHSMEIWNECAVCLSVFVDGEGIQPLTACKHAFHVACIENWLKEQNSCPICRAEVVSVKQTEGNLNVNDNGNGSVSAETAEIR